MLMSKHLFLALAPAYFVHLLRSQCVQLNGLWFDRLTRFNPCHWIPLITPTTQLYRCFAPSSSSPTTITSFRPLPFLALAATVLTIFGLALGPFIIVAGGKEEAIAQLQQIVARLFPFGACAPPRWRCMCGRVVPHTCPPTHPTPN